MHISYSSHGTKSRFPRDRVGVGQLRGESMVLGNKYLTRQAATLIKFARSTSDPQLVAALVDKAANLKSQVDESAKPDPSPRPPDVEPPAR
jgi:hypothetical protein